MTRSSWRFLAVLFTVFLFVSETGRGADFGTRLQFNKAELYYTPSIQKEDAEKLGDYLVSTGFFGDKEISAQITRDKGEVQFRFVVNKGMENDPKYVQTVRMFVSMLAQSRFPSEKVVAHLCDDQFKTLKNLPAFEHALKFEKAEIFFGPPVTPEEGKKLGEYLLKESFFSGKEIFTQLEKSGKVFTFRYVVKPGFENDSGYLQTVRAMCTELSKNVFENAQVNIDLCNEQFATVTSVEPLGEIVVKGGQVRFSKEAGEETARKLGDFLVETGFLDGREKTITIDLIDGVPIFGMVVKEGFEKDESFLKNAAVFAEEMGKSLFKRDTIDFHLCDQYLKTLKVVSTEDSKGESISVEKVEIRYTSGVKKEEAEKLGEFLKKNKFADGTPKTVQFSRRGSTYRFRFVVREGAEKDEAITRAAQETVGEISKDVLGGAPVEVHMCDDFLHTVKVFR